MGRLLLYCSETGLFSESLQQCDLIMLIQQRTAPRKTTILGIFKLKKNDTSYQELLTYLVHAGPTYFGKFFVQFNLLFFHVNEKTFPSLIDKSVNDSSIVLSLKRCHLSKFLEILCSFLIKIIYQMTILHYIIII